MKTNSKIVFNEALSNAMFVRESGTPGSPGVVFLYGVGNSSGMWVKHMTGLAGYHCLAPDLPGFGRSNHLPWKSRFDTTDMIASSSRPGSLPEGSIWWVSPLAALWPTPCWLGAMTSWTG